MLTPIDRLIGAAVRDFGSNLKSPCFDFKFLIGRLKEATN